MRAVISLLSLFFLLLVVPARAQKHEPSHGLKGSESLFVEIVGNAWYSLNYDRVFFQHQKNAVSGRVGANYMRYINQEVNAYTLLGEVNYLRGSSPHFFEAGIGLSYWDAPGIPKDREVNWTLVLRLCGYRYQKPQGGFFFRVGYTPWFDLEPGLDDPIALLRGGVSLGYTFKR